MGDGAGECEGDEGVGVVGALFDWISLLLIGGGLFVILFSRSSLDLGE